MKFTIELKELKNKLKILNFVASKNKLYPMTELLGVKASTPGIISLLATDNRIQMVTKVNADINDEVDFCIMLDPFYKLINKIKGTEIVCEVKDTFLKVISDSGVYSFEFITDDEGIVSFFVSDYMVNAYGLVNTLDVFENADIFFSICNKIGNNIISTAPEYDIVDGYFFKDDAFMVTCGDIVASKVHDMSVTFQDTIVPSKLMELCSLANCEQLGFIQDEYFIAFNEDSTIISLPSPYNEKYPRDAVSKECEQGREITHATFYVSELIDTIYRIDLFPKVVGNTCAYFTVYKNSLICSNGDGRFFEEIPLTLFSECQDKKFAINTKLLLKALKCFNDHCSICITDSTIKLFDDNTLVIVALEQLTETEKALIQWQENQD